MKIIRSIQSGEIFKTFPASAGINNSIKKNLRSISILKNLIMITFLLFAVSTSCSKNLTMKYSVLDENVVDTPSKTQITLKLKISGEITSDNCRELLNRLYNTYKNKEGLKYSKTPGSLFMYLYDSTESAEDPEQWIGMLSWAAATYKPQITIKEKIISELEKGSAEKFGLSLKKRKEIFEDTVLARDRAASEAEKKYPVPQLNSTNKDDPSYSRVFSSKKVQAQLEKQIEYIRQTAPKYVKEIIKKHNINQRILTEIAIEGYKKKWPLPIITDDGLSRGN